MINKATAKKETKNLIRYPYRISLISFACLALFPTHITVQTVGKTTKIPIKATL